MQAVLLEAGGWTAWPLAPSLSNYLGGSIPGSLALPGDACSLASPASCEDKAPCGSWETRLGGGWQQVGGKGLQFQSP